MCMLQSNLWFRIERQECSIFSNHQHLAVCAGHIGSCIPSLDTPLVWSMITVWHLTISGHLSSQFHCASGPLLGMEITSSMAILIINLAWFTIHVNHWIGIVGHLFQNWRIIFICSNRTFIHSTCTFVHSSHFIWVAYSFIQVTLSFVRVAP